MAGPCEKYLSRVAADKRSVVGLIDAGKRRARNPSLCNLRQPRSPNGDYCSLRRPTRTSWNRLSVEVPLSAWFSMAGPYAILARLKGSPSRCCAREPI